jgi:hypothetical protein
MSRHLTSIEERNKIVSNQKPEPTINQELEPIINHLGIEISWWDVAVNHKLSEEFIRKHHHNMDWAWISKYQHLSNEFVVEFIDEIDDFFVLKYQTHMLEETKLLIKLKQL